MSTDHDNRWPSSGCLLLLAALFALVLILAVAWKISLDRHQAILADTGDLWRGDEATEKIVEGDDWTKVGSREFILPNDKRFLWEGGTFNGLILYWSFQCGSVDECWERLLEDGSLTKRDFTPLESLPDRPFRGPQQYDARLDASLWRLQDVKNGVHYVWRRGDEMIQYIAIDLDTATVFGCYQSGGY